MRNIKTIIRQEKLKSWQKITAVGSHNNRLKPVLNADPYGENIRLIGSQNLVSDVKSLLIKFGIEPTKIRKNGVISNELILSLSPEFFEPNDGVEKFNSKSVDLFKTRAVSYLKKKYGQRIAHLSLHLDESTPHIHCVVVPIYKDKNDKKYKLSAKRFFDRDKLMEMQESYYKAFSDLPFITKYVHKSTASHKEVKTFYGELKQSLKVKEEIDNKVTNHINKLEATKSKLENKIAALEAENSNLNKQVHHLTRKLLKLKQRILAIVKFVNNHAQFKQSNLPKFLRRAINIFNKQSNHVEDIKTKVAGTKSNVEYLDKDLEAIKKNLNLKNNIDVFLKNKRNRKNK